MYTVVYTVVYIAVYTVVCTVVYTGGNDPIWHQPTLYILLSHSPLTVCWGLVNHVTTAQPATATVQATVVSRSGRSQGLLYKHLCHSLPNWLSHWSFVKISLRRRHALMFEDGAFSNKIDYCDKTKKIKLWLNLTYQNVTKVNNSNWNKRKNLNSDRT